MTSVAELISRLVAAGAPPEIAAIVVTEAFVAGVSCGKSGGIPVDAAAERRRIYDRDRKRESRRKSADSGGIPVESPRTSKSGLLLTSLSKEEEGSKESKKVRARKHQLPVDWWPNDKHFEAAERLHIPHAAVFEKAEDMRLWARGSGAVKADWDATFHGFLRRDARRGYQNGQDKSVLGAIDRLEERLKGGADYATVAADFFSLPPK